MCRDKAWCSLTDAEIQFWNWCPNWGGQRTWLVGSTKGEFKSTDFPCQIAITKNPELNHQVNKQTLHNKSIS